MDILNIYIIPMTTKVQRWGNSLGVRLPKFAAEQVSLKAGSEVDVRVDGGQIVVRPLKKKSYKLKDLLAAIKPAHLHPEIGGGRPAGRELP